MVTGKSLTDAQKQVADMIYDRGAVKFERFKLKLHEKDPEAPLSPIYLALRQPPDGPLTDTDVKAIAKELYILVEKQKVLFNVVAGIPRAGEPFAETIAQWSGRPLLKLGKTTEGDKRKIDSIVSGEYRPGQLVLLVDDLITQADTKKETVSVCENAGLVVAGLVVLVDREQGGTEELGTAGYAVYAAFPLSVLLDYYVEVSKIDLAKRDEVLNYIADNR